MDCKKSKIGPKACTICAKAKARCNPGPTEQICERCHRLNKPCSAQTPAPPRKRKAPKPTRVAELEKRLESLTARVESRQLLPPTLPVGEPLDSEALPPETRKPGDPDGADRADRVDTVGHKAQPGYLHIFADYQIEKRAAAENTQNEHHQSGVAAVEEAVHVRALGQGEWPPAGSTSRSSSTLPISENNTPMSQSHGSFQATPAPQAQPSPLRNGGATLTESREPWYYPSATEAQEFLERYRDHIVPLFPFVVVPPNTTAEALRGKSPLLWKAIMMQGLFLHARRQVLMGEEVMRDAVTASFIQGRKSLDLLQGMEVLIAWFHSSAKSFELTNLLFLIRAICVSLGFNESQEFSEQQSTSLASLEQMRAFTGVYYLVTMVFTTNKKPDAFMNTTYLDHCCRILEERMEYPSDELVVLLVRTQQLSQSISMTIAFRNNRDSLPLALAVQSFQHEIRRLRSSIPQSLRDDVSLNTQLHIVETLLYEVAISDELSAGLAPAERLELLWKCLTSARSSLDARFSRPYNGWPRCTSLSSFDFTYAMLICLTLSLLQLPGWDLRVVRKEFDFDKYLVLQLEDLKTSTARRRLNELPVDNAGGATSGEIRPVPFQDPHARLHARLSQLRLCILAELAATLPPDPQQPKEMVVPALPNTSSGSAEGQRSGLDAEGMILETFGDNFLGFDDVSWQEMYRPNEWDMNFSTLLGWDAGDDSVPNYTDWLGDGRS